MSPAAGTHTRAIYDVFMRQKGKPIAFTPGKRDYEVMDRLRDFYGLDIRRVDKGKWVLAGEWFASKYVDYIAERLER